MKNENATAGSLFSGSGNIELVPGMCRVVTGMCTVVPCNSEKSTEARKSASGHAGGCAGEADQIPCVGWCVEYSPQGSQIKR